MGWDDNMGRVLPTAQRNESDCYKISHDRRLIRIVPTPFPITRHGCRQAECRMITITFVRVHIMIIIDVVFVLKIDFLHQ